ncbi:hypothetical protein [Streptomyces scopuliridis]|uniref:hypothetical protein n=1 Tax=Streptomyces scopuliridis TaxID=452529 RepID=UPI00367536EB
MARTEVSIGFHDAPDRYDTGDAASSASTRPSDICQNRACGVRRSAGSLTRSACGSFLPFGSFSRLGTSSFPPAGGPSGPDSLSSSENQPLTVWAIPLPSLLFPAESGAA